MPSGRKSEPEGVVGNISAHLIVKGLVQGVGFRWFVRSEANHRGLTGTVANLSDGQVEIRAEGDRSAIDDFIAALKAGNGYCRVDSVKTDFGAESGHYDDFRIKMMGI